MRRRLDAAGYVEVKTPQLLDRALWERPATGRSSASTCSRSRRRTRSLALKPMNCPGHVQIFNQGQKSYRDLPLRMAEFGSCHRYEPSGALHGLMRVRAFTQDDAHIFCPEDQITAGVEAVLRAAADGLPRLRLGVRGQLRRPAAGARRLRRGLGPGRGGAAGRPPGGRARDQVNPGEGAFYGPKLEFVLRDAIGRKWQCGTIQLDFVLPERLDAEYVGEDGQKHRPVMLHRAIFGSLERFIGILIENYAGGFRSGSRRCRWWSPRSPPTPTPTRGGGGGVGAAGLRVETDLRNEKINYKVREHSLAKVPVIAVVGAREAEEGKVALRRLGQAQQESLALGGRWRYLSTSRGRRISLEAGRGVVIGA